MHEKKTLNKAAKKEKKKMIYNGNILKIYQAIRRACRYSVQL